MLQHTAALKAKIETIPALRVKTFVLTAPKGTVPPYLILYPADGVDEQTRFTGPKATQHPRFTVHLVGVSYEQCASVAKLLKDRLMPDLRGVILDVPGERCGELWFSSPIPIQADYDATPPLIWYTAECGFETNPV